MQKGYSFRLVHELESEFQYLLARRVYLRRRASHFHSFSRVLRKISTYVHDSSVKPLLENRSGGGDSSGRLSLDLSSRGFSREGYDGERSLGVYTVVHTRKSPFLLTLRDTASSTTLSYSPCPSVLLVPFPSPTPFSSHLRRCAPTRSPLAHPSTLLLAPIPSLSLSLSPSWTLLVRFHPRPSTFRVYRTIARARITVTGRATSWLAVDVGGGRTADRRRRERRRRRRRRRGRAQQIVSETRRATKKKKSSVFSAISRSRYVLEKARALCHNIRRVRRVESTIHITRGDPT